MLVRATVALVLTAFLRQPVGATTIRVPEHYPTIQGALAVAVAGDTISVGPGEWWSADYYDMVDGATITGRGWTDTTWIMTTIRVAETTMETVIEELGFKGRDAQVLCKGGSPIVRNNVFRYESCAYWGDVIGVRCTQGAGPVIRDNIFKGWSWSLECDVSGIWSSDSSPIIIGNEFLGQRDVSVTGIGVARLIGNTFTNVEVRVSGGAVADTIRGNTFLGWDGALRLGSTTPTATSVIRNTFDDCYPALYLSNYSHPLIRKNKFISCGRTLYVSGYQEPFVIDVEENWWGTIVREDIESSFYYGDNSEGAIIDFDPWCVNSACTMTAVVARTWGTIKTMFR
jgi:hypothetical protein